MQIRYSCTESSHFARLISVRNSFSLQYQPLPVHLASADPPHAPLPASTNARSKQTPLTAAHPGGRRPKRAHRPSGSVLLRTDVAHICSKNHCPSTQSEIIVNELDSVDSPRSLIRLFQVSIPRGHIAGPRDGN